MEDKALLAEAYQLVSELNQTIQSCKQGLPDDQRLQQIIDQLLNQLKKAKKLDNSILIELESFYQRTSLLIGLGSLKLNDQARTAWRNYDKFHYDHVKHTLTLYGPVFGF
ncbi:helicase BlpT [Streptococcus sp. SM5]|uniref:helicase BlpT n=1 Tax=Streptococcus sp. SM5 TaxID=2898232 RepID=UPI0022B7CB1B|nr:helicase BlpT [Streptococcus sp. SM5]